MKHRINDYSLSSRLIYDFERISANEGSPKIQSSHREYMRMKLNGSQALINTSDKILSSAQISPVVPIVGFSNVSFGFAENYNIKHSDPRFGTSQHPNYSLMTDFSQKRLSDEAAPESSIPA